MEYKSIYEITFSPTGGTKRVAGLFAEAWEADKKELDLTDRTFAWEAVALKEDDLCIVAVPSYGGRVPKVAAERLSRLQGNQAGAILITVYGNRAYEDTMAEMQDILTGRGFRCIAAIAAIAEHSIMRQFATGRPDEEDGRRMAEFAWQIQNRLLAETVLPEVKVPGNRPYKPYQVAVMTPEAGAACSRCGLCAAKCPTGAILQDSPEKTDAAACISCMRCVAVCPRQARSVDRQLILNLSERLETICSERKEYQLYW